MKNILFFCFVTISLSVFAQGDIQTIILNDSIKLELEREPFQKNLHKIKFVNETDLIIDNSIVFGTDGVIPRFYLKRAVIKIKDKEINLETSSMYNPWFGDKPNESAFGMKLDGTHLIIKGYFSDAAGSYGVEWLIIGGKSIRTILTNNDQILFEYLKY